MSNQRQHRFFNGDFARDMKSRAKNIVIKRSIVHLQQVADLLGMNPEELDLVESEWDSDVKVEYCSEFPSRPFDLGMEEDLQQFKELFDGLDVKKTAVYLPFKRTSDFPKIPYPVATPSQLEQIEYFNQAKPNEFLTLSRMICDSQVDLIMEHRHEESNSDKLRGHTIYFVGDQNDISIAIEKMDGLLASTSATSRALVRNIRRGDINLVVITDEQGQKQKACFAAISNCFKQFLGNGTHQSKAFNRIIVRGEFIDDNMLAGLSLISENYHFTGCPYLTLNEVFAFANDWMLEKGRILRTKSTVFLGGTMGIGDLSSELKETTGRIPNFYVNFENALITNLEQEQLKEKVKVFDVHTSNAQWWKSVRYKEAWDRNDKVLWDLNTTIEHFLDIGLDISDDVIAKIKDPFQITKAQKEEFVERALVLAGNSEPGLTRFESLAEDRAESGKWPLFLITKAKLAKARGDDETANRFLDEAISRSDSIRKDYWSSNKEYYAEQRASYKRKFVALKNHLYKDLNNQD